MKRRAAPLTLFLLALALTVPGADRRGAMWPDSPRYANAAAMIRDWLRSGELAHPFGFAERDYFQYPAFNVPYHPPGYPALVGVLFLFTGVSYFAMKCFVALCWVGCVLLFYFTQRRFGFPLGKAWLLSAVFLTTPELLRWSRDTMSEIPSLFFLFASSFAYLNWFESGRRRSLILAFALFVVAVQSRVTVVSVFPAWGMFALFSGRFRDLLKSRLFVGLSVLFILLVGLWVIWVRGYARFEIDADGRADGFSWRHLLYFTDVARDLLLGGDGLMLFGGFLLFVAVPKPDPATKFWLAWLLSTFAFKLLMPTTPEPRHFLFALPAFVGIGGRWLTVEKRGWSDLGMLLCSAAIMLNLRGIYDLPNGLQGYEPVARLLAEQNEPGNVFLACPHDQDLIFRYRCLAPDSTRLMIRSDRTLSTRVADYAKREEKPHVATTEEVLETLRRGRVRYLAVVEETDSPPFDWRITRQTIREHPDQFESLSAFPLRVEFVKPGYELTVAVYRLKGDLRPGPSELPLSIPTAGMDLSGIGNRESGIGK